MIRRSREGHEFTRAKRAQERWLQPLRATTARYRSDNHIHEASASNPAVEKNCLYDDNLTSRGCPIHHHPEYRQRYAANLRANSPGSPLSEATEPSQSADNSPGGAADVSPGRKPGVDRKIENNSALPKAVAGGHSPQATSPHQCWRTAEAPLNFPKIIATKSPAR